MISIDLLDQLEGLLSTARRIPLTPNVIVGENEALDLIDRARMELPEDIQEARRILERQRQLIGEAEEQAKRLVNTAQVEAEAIEKRAEERAGQLTAEHQIVRAAEERALHVEQTAARRAMEVRREADAYARQLMENLEDQLTRALAIVRKGLEQLPVTSVTPEPKARQAETSRRRRA